MEILEGDRISQRFDADDDGENSLDVRLVRKGQLLAPSRKTRGVICSYRAPTGAKEAKSEDLPSRSMTRRGMLLK